MWPPVDTRVPEQVEDQVQTLYADLFPGADSRVVTQAFDWARLCFEGKYPGYQAVDLKYHDLEHTLQGALCMVRMLSGRARAGDAPALTHHGFELGLLAVLFHDSGYLKESEDTSGTGAKYTMIHVARGAEFAARFLKEKGYPSQDLSAVQNMIRCTGVSGDPQTLPFQNPLERVLGYTLGTADLLGQMAAADYIEKLPILYLEFEEARQFSGNAAAYLCYADARELMSRTPAFWKQAVLPRINETFQRMHAYLNQPYPDGPNPYLIQIETNIARLNAQLRAGHVG